MLIFNQITLIFWSSLISVTVKAVQQICYTLQTRIFQRNLTNNKQKTAYYYDLNKKIYFLVLTPYWPSHILEMARPIKMC